MHFILILPRLLINRKGRIMNIFIMILVAIFMVGFYMISSPSQRVTEQETEYAITRADLRSVAECAAAEHNAKIRGTTFTDVCTEQNNIKSEFICLNSNLRKTNCEIVRNKKPDYSYLITTTNKIDDSNYNDMLEILETYFPDTGTFGIFLDGKIMSGGQSHARTVPDTIIKEMELENGQLVYLTQYEIPDTETEFAAPIQSDVLCPTGTVKTYRFGRWQCIGYNTKTDCGGDMIWDSELLECVPDETKKPLCASQQTAVIVDNIWECVNPFPEKVCPDNMVAKLNYTTLEWECVANPSDTDTVKKCDTITQGAIYGALGSTVRVSSSSCTDCEIMLTDPETCVSVCVPDPAKVNSSKCYPGNPKECTGTSRAFYFGFPSYSYAANVSEIRGKRLVLDKNHSQNRKFNCLDCGDKEIDTEKSFPPYIAVCKQ